MKPMRYTLSPEDDDPDLIAESQTPDAGGPQALALTAPQVVLDVARPVLITTAADETGRTFTVTGRDRVGNPITEDVTGVNDGTVETVKSFKIVTSVTVDDDTADAIEVGTTDTIWTPWFPLDHYAAQNVSVAVELSEDANLQVDGYSTLSRLQDAGFDDGGHHRHFQEEDAARFEITALASLSASVRETVDYPMTGIRFRISSFVAGSVSFFIMQEST